ncbi:putative lipoprotein [Leptospira fainei serovar Hurstbridge str. BUT 6]|uniref:Lipoprotein n=1 Tax=Leptospira fainei serovar Hurstbridge str. BUT 6 TaxID=1193011 RepID=S3UW79_9LEPT|nr:LruC domain-containing protein [Leptospira fainei]EPG73498.1 putative lipoprotein [Leptospira fainei serovar Hurstbridge str. BUT 6]
MADTTKKISKIWFALGLCSLISCSSQQNPDYAWLLSLAQGATPVAAPTGSSDFSVQVQDASTPVDFAFDTTRTLTVNVQVIDPVAPVNGSLVQLTVASATPGTPSNKSIFTAYTNTNGQVTGSFTVDSDTNTVHLQVQAYGKFYDIDINITNVTVINRRISISFTANETLLVDTDGDGVPDVNDAYPLDPTRAFIVRIPVSDYYTIAFEDLFPNEGDADFNDYAVRTYFEEDLNAKGGVARVRGYFTHVAKGAAYNHTLHFSLPNAASVSSYTLNRLGYDGTTVEQALSGTGPAISGLEILGNSSTTIQSWNSRKTDTFHVGKSAHLEVILSAPISTTNLGPPPFDTYLHVINTNKDIHAAGKFFDAKGADLYRDSTGFPWYLLIPGNFLWPYEGENIRIPYSQFKTWYESLGTTDIDWYRNPDKTKVFQSTP